MTSLSSSQPSLRPLHLHVADTRRPRHQISAVARPHGTGFLELTFEVQNFEQIVWPPKPSTSALREDGLWRSTCFECFVGSSMENYAEWNFSPNGNWAAYDFTSYRAGMRNADVVAPTIRETSREGRREYSIRFRHNRAPSVSAVDLSLTAVVLEVGVAEPFYWASHHAGPKPDFHLKESFRLRLEF